MKRILIVDDSVDLLEAMEIILIQKGFKVQTLPSWHNIDSNIINFEPDLIILDIFLAGKDGREICKELRNKIESKYLCIMMFSASSKALEDYSAYGADDFLEKPFGITYLIEKIERVLSSCKEKSF
ncbi:MAG: response regulator [Bacteroidota bacterium]|nr:response regulator [Bacteroidota bacterium]